MFAIYYLLVILGLITVADSKPVGLDSLTELQSFPRLLNISQLTTKNAELYAEKLMSFPQLSKESVLSAAQGGPQTSEGTNIGGGFMLDGILNSGEHIKDNLSASNPLHAIEGVIQPVEKIGTALVQKGSEVLQIFDFIQINMSTLVAAFILLQILMCLCGICTYWIVLRRLAALKKYKFTE